jgi:hypothetical protein
MKITFYWSIEAEATFQSVAEDHAWAGEEHTYAVYVMKFIAFMPFM